jgi:hypothetical protein
LHSQCYPSRFDEHVRPLAPKVCTVPGK